MNTLLTVAIVLGLCIVAFVVIGRIYPSHVYSLLGWIFERLSWLWMVTPSLERWFWQRMDKLERFANQQILKHPTAKDRKVISSAAYYVSGGYPNALSPAIIKEIDDRENHIPSRQHLKGQPPAKIENLPNEEVPERSPFCIRDCNQEETMVRVYFKQLTPEDYLALESEEWQDCSVHRKQKAFAGFFRSCQDVPDEQHRIWKIVRTEDKEQRAEGLLWIAENLENCYLDVAPWNQKGVSRRQYCGVGTALVGRLLLESKRREQGGAFALLVVPEAITFYENLGFEPGPGESSVRFSISEEKGDALLQKVCCRGSVPVIM